MPNVCCPDDDGPDEALVCCDVCHQWDGWHTPDCPAIPVEDPPTPVEAP